ncbi:MAG: ankyrin repeat domain-containing protein [Gammaproteobacteria bacterium]|nr:ankyrin repeat domain-containing protein [Gammaproteobacteria bacterium]MCW5583593.1 ankyrin repeat domain-containing protein [Gammaproteobacteria bacterium]
MKMAGYTGDPGGVCLGIAYVARNPLLLGGKELEYYNKRIGLMKEMYPDQLQQLIESLGVKEDSPTILDDLIESLWQKYKKLENVNKEQAKTIYEQHQKLLDIKVFLDNIEAMHNSHLHPELSLGAHLTYQSEQYASLVESKQVTARRGMVLANKETCLNGHLYKGEAGLNLLKNELSAIQKIAVSYDFPICLTLHSRNHVCDVKYDPKQNLWQLVNAGSAVKVEFEELPKIINLAFSYSEKFIPEAAIFSMRIFTLKSETDDLNKFNEFNQAVALLKEQQDIEHLNMIAANLEMIDTPNAFGDTLLSCAVYDGNTKQVDQLLAFKADPNNTTAVESYLIVAASRNYHDIVGKLIAAGATVDAISNGITPLYIAAQNGNLETCNVLLSHQADPNYKCSLPGLARSTPTTAALCFKHQEVFEILFKDNKKFNALKPTIQISKDSFKTEEELRIFEDNCLTAVNYSFHVNYKTCPILFAAFNGSVSVVRSLYQTINDSEDALKENMKIRICNIAEQRGYKDFWNKVTEQPESPTQQTQIKQ